MTNMLLAFFRVTQRASLLLAFLVLLAMILSSGAVYMLGGDLGSIQGDIDSGSRLFVAVCIVYAVSRIIGDFSKRPTAVKLQLSEEQRHEVLKALESEIKRTNEVLNGAMQVHQAVQERARRSVKIMEALVKKLG